MVHYFGSIDYYAGITRDGGVMDPATRFDKRRKEAHRCVIADTRGALTLTVPISHPMTHNVTWNDIHVSTHGAWWDVHRVALESAYGRTPYFEFYIDRFLPAFRPRTDGDCETIAELDLFLDREIRKILEIDGHVESKPTATLFPVVPYYQVRAGKLGFIPHLSVLDLIFNMGPESPLVIDKMIKSS